MSTEGELPALDGEVWRGEAVVHGVLRAVGLVERDGYRVSYVWTTYVNGGPEWKPASAMAGAVYEAWALSLRAERDEARDCVRRLTATSRVLTCAYCGEAYPPGTPDHGADVLTAHVRICAKHPMRTVEAKLDAVVTAARGLIGNFESADMATEDRVCALRSACAEAVR